MKVTVFVLLEKLVLLINASNLRHFRCVPVCCASHFSSHQRLASLIDSFQKWINNRLSCISFWRTHSSNPHVTLNPIICLIQTLFSFLKSASCCSVTDQTDRAASLSSPTVITALLATLYLQSCSPDSCLVQALC